MPHGTPDVVEIVQRVAARGATGRLQLRKQPTRLRRKLTRQTGGHLDIASESGIPGDRGKTLAREGAVTDRVVAVGSVEQVDIAAPGVVAGIHDLAHFVESGGGDRSTRSSHLEELGLV